MSRGAGRGNVTIDGAEGAIPVVVNSNLIDVAYDSIYLSYTGDDLTGVVYKLLSTPVATLTLTYSSSILQSVVKG